MDAGKMPRIVVPGDLLSEEPAKVGEGAYIEDGKVYASVYGVLDKKDRIRVIPLAGKYIPKRGDTVIGSVTEISFSNWILDIASPYEAYLHISEYPRRIEPGEMSKYIRVGDLIVATVLDVDWSMMVELTLRENQFKVLRGGRLLEISHTRVPRLIGRGGSMISMIKRESRCSIFVGQNGRVWLQGKPENMKLAAQAIEMVVREAHTPGLTNRVVEFLRANR
ncbi:MAG: RNA-binding protein Rrp4 (containing S1 domain and KH domain) [Candidatus Syntrophoarchaeum butanivorans]|uniref:Exosome complex component Rrp4 n=2 Tax=Candidatus Syntropharchaeum butanivorans TaxID=1839936 RepID=A0A1F2P7S2_9EURY|nr:MAG: RNA-binding protein Rrp4 (containing S1 domain and KH domain) [Candidatus Syntrophoarchaeum butanivorans]